MKEDFKILSYYDKVYIKDYISKFSVIDYSYLSHYLNKPKIYIREHILELLNVKGLGYKNETYYSEEELLQGYVAPTFDELSLKERAFYRRYNKNKPKEIVTIKDLINKK